MTLPDPDGLLAWMATAADAVSRALAAESQSPDKGTVVAMGADGTPTLVLDRWAEDAVLGCLDQAPVKLGVLSEERERTEAESGLTLVLDPIDGSRNAVRSVPFYSVSMAIGATRQSDVQVGLVANLATGQTYTARRGGGAELDGKPIRVRPYDPNETIAGVTLPYEGHLASASASPIHVRSMGAASLEICLVAEGAFDVYASRQPSLRITDVAAATLILEEAGGHAFTPPETRFDADFDARKRLAFLGVGDRKSLQVLP